MLWLGLTGGLGSGKSTVAALLRQAGIAVVDADELSRLAVRPGEPAFVEIVKVFGKQVLGRDGALDRRRLGQEVFGDREKLKLLEGIIHPRVRENALQQRKDLEAKGHDLAFYDVPLLYEKALEDQFDAVVVVSCSLENQIRRTMVRDKLSREQVLERLSNQIPLNQKASRADHVIQNDGSKEDLRVQVDRVTSQLKARLKKASSRQTTD